jgi:fructose/tagatose bisphosphate aldolase
MPATDSSLVLHGGSGVIDRADLTEAQDLA